MERPRVIYTQTPAEILLQRRLQALCDVPAQQTQQPLSTAEEPEDAVTTKAIGGVGIGFGSSFSLDLAGAGATGCVQIETYAHSSDSEVEETALKAAEDKQIVPAASHLEPQSYEPEKLNEHIVNDEARLPAQEHCAIVDKSLLDESTFHDDEEESVPNRKNVYVERDNNVSSQTSSQPSFSTQNSRRVDHVPNKSTRPQLLRAARKRRQRTSRSIDEILNSKGGGGPRTLSEQLVALSDAVPRRRERSRHPGRAGAIGSRFGNRCVLPRSSQTRHVRKKKGGLKPKEITLDELGELASVPSRGRRSNHTYADEVSSPDEDDRCSLASNVTVDDVEEDAMDGDGDGCGSSSVGGSRVYRQEICNSPPPNNRTCVSSEARADNTADAIGADVSVGAYTPSPVAPPHRAGHASGGGSAFSGQSFCSFPHSARTIHAELTPLALPCCTCRAGSPYFSRGWQLKCVSHFLTLTGVSSGSSGKKRATWRSVTTSKYRSWGTGAHRGRQSAECSRLNANHTDALSTQLRQARARVSLKLCELENTRDESQQRCTTTEGEGGTRPAERRRGIFRGGNNPWREDPCLFVRIDGARAVDGHLWELRAYRIDRVPSSAGVGVCTVVSPMMSTELEGADGNMGGAGLGMDGNAAKSDSADRRRNAPQPDNPNIVKLRSARKIVLLLRSPVNRRRGSKRRRTGGNGCGSSCDVGGDDAVLQRLGHLRTSVEDAKGVLHSPSELIGRCLRVHWPPVTPC